MIVIYTERRADLFFYNGDMLLALRETISNLWNNSYADC